jgi:hypothetical protein
MFFFCVNETFRDTSVSVVSSCLCPVISPRILFVSSRVLRGHCYGNEGALVLTMSAARARPARVRGTTSAAREQCARREHGRRGFAEQRARRENNVRGESTAGEGSRNNERGERTMSAARGREQRARRENNGRGFGEQ